MIKSAQAHGARFHPPACKGGKAIAPRLTIRSTCPLDNIVPYRAFLMPIYNTVESIIDGCRNRVVPEIGSVLYCDLAFGYMDHSGIYIGDNKIVHLNRHGKIQVTTPKGFINGGTAIHIYVSCRNGASVGSSLSAERALSMIGGSRRYHVLLDNCHQFSCGCLTGNFDNTDNYLWALKKRSGEHLRANTWRYWDIDLF